MTNCIMQVSTPIRVWFDIQHPIRYSRRKQQDEGVEYQYSRGSLDKPGNEASHPISRHEVIQQSRLLKSFIKNQADLQTYHN